MEFDFDKLLQKGEQIVGAVQKTAGDLAHKGKAQLDLAAAQSKLSKAQRQLGELVYEMARNGEENRLLVQKYVDTIGEIQKEISDIQAGKPAEEADAQPEEASEEQAPQQEEAPRACAQCGAEVLEGAVFCSRCGAQL